MVMRCTCNADKRVRFSPAAVYRVPGPVAGRLSPKQQTGVRFFRYSYLSVLWYISRFDSGHRKVDCSSTAEPQIVDLMMRVRLPPFQKKVPGVSDFPMVSFCRSSFNLDFVFFRHIANLLFGDFSGSICLSWRNHMYAEAER